MILPIHIAIALASVAFTAYLYFFPSKAKLQVSYTLMGLTLATGTYLVLSQSAHMLEACMVGILYTGAVSFGILSARSKLATATK